jgi:hypothetical protein
VHSVAALVLAGGLLQVPFGSSVDVHVPASLSVPALGSVAGDFLVVGRSRAGEGAIVVTLRPLAIGTLAVPLPGARPSNVEVRPILAAGMEPRPLLVPEPPPFPWTVLAASVVAVVLLLAAVHLLRHRSRRDPVAELRRALVPLAAPRAWEAAGAADALARGCRGFLQAVTGSPCEAMTTRELTRLLASRLEIACAAPFALALVLADDARFAGNVPPAEEAATLVRNLLDVAPVAGGQG